MSNLDQLKPVAVGVALVAACAAIAWSSPASAAETSSMAASAPATMGSSSSGKVNKATTEFVTKAAGNGMYEVQVAKLAADHAASNDVKGFAQMLVDDHTTANNELTTLANGKGIALPTGIPKAAQAKIDKLSKLQGKAFDTAFIEQVGIKDHRADIALFDGYAKVPGDTDIKAFASKTLPTLRHHLTDAQGLPKKMSGTMTGGHVVDTPRP